MSHHAQVDEKAPLKEPIEIMENGEKVKLRTVGDKWSYFQRMKFGANAQPFYVLLDHQASPWLPRTPSTKTSLRT